MADDTAALVLSLEARFDKFEKQMKDAAGVVDKQTKVIEDRFDAMTKVISNKLSSIQGVLIAQLGTFGSALASLGPLGTVAAVGLGLLAAGFNQAAEMADKFGQKAQELQRLSQITGFSATQIAALEKLGRAFNVAGEDTDNFLERFTAKMEAARRGQGDLFDAVQRIDRGLALQLAASKTGAQALDVLAAAYSKATTEGNQFAATQLTVAAGGKGGIAAGPLLKGVKEAGGTQTITDMADNIDEATKRVAALKTQTEELKKSSDKAWASIASEEVQQKLKQAAEIQLRIAQSAAEQKKAYDAMNMSWLQQLMQFLASGAVSDLNDMVELQKTQQQLTEQGNRIRGQAMVAQKLATGQRADQFPGFDKFFGGKGIIDDETAATKANTTAKKDNALTAQAQFEIAQREMAVLGDAATLTELAALNEKKLAAARAEGTISAQTAERAELNYQRSLAQRALAAKEALGVATQAEIFAGRAVDIQKKLETGEIDYTRAIQARAIAQKEAQAKFEEEQVRAAQFPGLKRAFLDAQNAAKQFDAFALRSIDTFADEMVNAINGTKSLSQAFTDMTRSILNDLAKILIKKALLSALDIALPGTSSLFSTTSGSIMGPRMAGGPVSAGGTFLVGERGPELFVPSAAGFIVPNNALRSSNNGSPINFGGISVDARGASPGIDAHIIGRLRAEMPGIAIAAVAQAQRYGTLRARR